MTRRTQGIVFGVTGAVLAVAVGLWLTRRVEMTADLAVATRGPLRVTLDADARTRVVHRVMLSAPVPGRLLATTRAAGETVTRGEPVFTIVAGATAGARQRGRRVQVRAPLTGRVLRVLEAHERLVSKGTPLMEVGDPRDLEVVARVPEKIAAELRTGTPILVRAENSETRLPGTVTSVDSAASPQAPSGDTFTVYGTFDSPPRGLGDGARVTVSFVLWEGADVVRIPVTALVAAKAGTRVFRVRGGRAQAVDVKVGHRGSAKAEIESGLAAGDTVVALPTRAMRSGVWVTGVVWGDGS